MTSNWRDRAGTLFDCEKQPAAGSRGMVTANNPLGAMAGAEMQAAGGNAVDAAVATLFTLTVVEPMMVGISGGGIFHMLPVAEHDPHFTRFFATPHGIDPRPVVEAHGIDFLEATGEDVGDIVATALSTPGSTVVHVRSDREANQRMHSETRAAVERRVLEALG